MKTKSILFALIIISILLFSCRKYDDNPLIDIGSVQCRIEGIWDVQYIFVNSVDSTYYLKSDTCYRPLKFLSYEEAISNTNVVSANQNYTACDIYGFYSFVNSKNDLSIDLYSCGFNNVGFFGCHYGQALIWEIKKLTSDQLWIERTSNGINCWIHFTKQ